VAKSEQNFGNHRRWVPVWHYFAIPVLTLNIFVAAFRMWQQGFAKGTIWDFVVAIALVLAVFYSRVMALTAQNRVIRVEERMRMQGKLPADLHGRINDLSTGHLVGLRFASDEDLPGLARRCMDGELKGSADVKKAIKTWRADNLRV